MVIDAFTSPRRVARFGFLAGALTAASKRPDESPTLLLDAKNLLDTLDNSAGATGARAAPWSASWVVDYAFAKDAPGVLRGLRLGVNGIWRDDYLFGVPNRQKMIGGSSHLVHAYVMREQKIWGQQTRIRVGVRNLVDLENNDVRKTSFTTLASGANVYRFIYVMPPQYSAEVTVKF